MNPNRRLLTSGVVLVAVIWFVAAYQGSREESHPPRGVQQPGGPTVTAANPIVQQLQIGTGAERLEGVGVALLVDVSGSMAEAVRDVGGASKPKIEIAQRAALAVVAQCDRFAKEHPDKPILLGVYEFSALDRQGACRQVVGMGPPNAATAGAAVRRMHPGGGTPIGSAVIAARQVLNRTGISRQHILVVTDGENNQGYAPGDVANAMTQLKEDDRPSLYFIAFDVSAEKFRSVRDAGGLVLAAANGQELQQTLDYVLTGKILAEQPSVPGK